MKKRLHYVPCKLIITQILLSFLAVHAHTMPKALDIAHHPIHFKLNTPSLKPTGLTPGQVSMAYGFNEVSAKGKGQVIAIIVAFDSPRIEADLAVFNKQFALPPCTSQNGCFKKIYANNKKPPTDADWSGEIALDVEWAHALAPEAKIILVEAANDSMKNLLHAVQVAILNRATVVSMSWGSKEFAQQLDFDSIFKNPKVSFTAASGDSGNGVQFPASSPYVLAIGGTSLSVDSSGNYQGEEAWSGSGGGVSLIETWSDAQKSLPIPLSNRMRGVPDVAYNADPDNGFSVYSSVAVNKQVGWQVAGGTSAGAPQWAALIAVINSQWKTNFGNINSMLYAAANPITGKYDSIFNDIISGSNGQCNYYCSTQEGYDYVTGLGSPKVANLIKMLND